MCTQRKVTTASWMKAWSVSLVTQLELFKEHFLALKPAFELLDDIVLAVEVTVAEQQERPGTSFALDSVNRLGPELDALTEMLGFEIPVLGIETNAVAVHARRGVAIHQNALQVLGGHESFERGCDGLLPYGKDVGCQPRRTMRCSRRRLLGPILKRNF
jgi:hypothetical protein